MKDRTLVRGLAAAAVALGVLGVILAGSSWYLVRNHDILTSEPVGSGSWSEGVHQGIIGEFLKVLVLPVLSLAGVLAILAMGLAPHKRRHRA